VDGLWLFCAFTALWYARRACGISVSFLVRVFTGQQNGLARDYMRYCSGCCTTALYSYSTSSWLL